MTDRPRTRSPERRPAKITRPRLHDAVARPNVRCLLDRWLPDRTVWIVAPPGAGKTTAVASYLETGRRDGLWYQLDASDDDPGTFFSYAALALRTRPGGARATPPPIFAPEVTYDLPGFARRFFRHLYSQLRPGAVVVLDNVQDVAARSTLHAVLAEAVESVPEGVGVVMISREVPPPVYARSVANERLVCLDWDTFQLTLEETTAIVLAREAGATAEDIAALHERCAGWVAGLTLLMAQMRRGERIADLSEPSNLQEVFDYFASQVLARARPEVRDALLALAWFPRVLPSLAARLVPGQPVEPMLASLYRNHLFVNRRTTASGAGANPGTDTDRFVYQFHALFQSFLRHRAEQDWSAERLAGVRSDCANLLRANGDHEDAFQLFTLIRDWPAAAETLAGLAPVLLSAGRWKTLLEWIGLLPDPLLEERPALSYWRGMAIAATDPVGARAPLERVFDRACRQEDAVTRLMAAAAVIDTYLLEYTHFQGMDRWIDEVVGPLASESVPLPDADTALRICCAAIGAMTFRRPSHPFRGDCVERTLRLIPEARDVNVAVGGIGALLLHAGLTGRVLLGRRIDAWLDRYTGRPELRPHVHAVALFGLAYLFHLDILNDRSRLGRAVGRLHDLARTHEIPYLQCFADLMEWMQVNSEQSPEEALRKALALDKYRASGRPFDVGTVHNSLSWYGASAGDTALAVGQSDILIPLWRSTGSRFHSGVAYLPLLWGLWKTGQCERLAAAWREFEDEAADTGPALDAAVLVCEVIFALDRGERETAVTRTRELLSLCAAEGCIYMMTWIPDWFSRILSVALAEDIGGTLPRDCLLSVRSNWYNRPALLSHDEWPWPIRIFVLGPFRLLVDEEVRQFEGKPPKRLLALLQCLVALGGHGVPLVRLADELWPDDDGDRAQGALRIAIHRLRELLGYPGALVVHDGSLSLDLHLVWVDALVFGKRVATAKLGDHAAEAAATALDRGAFLAQEAAAWAVSPRECYRTEFVQLVSGAGARHEARAEWEQALEAYRRGLQCEELADALRRGSLRCLVALGRETEALEEYSAYQRLLSLRFGSAPSSEIAQLAEAIRLRRSPGYAGSGSGRIAFPGSVQET